MTDTQNQTPGCAHVTLKRQNSGSFHWYACEDCGQKFKAEEWDGKVKVVPAPEQAERPERCHADKDGDCLWSECPQLRDGEPLKTGRHCPLDTEEKMG